MNSRLVGKSDVVDLGVHLVTLEFTDGLSQPKYANFSINITNAKPASNHSFPDLTFSLGKTISHQFPLANFFDKDAGDRLSYSMLCHEEAHDSIITLQSVIYWLSF